MDQLRRSGRCSKSFADIVRTIAWLRNGSCIGALMLHSRPSQHATWGAVIIMFSVLNLFIITPAIKKKSGAYFLIFPAAAAEAQRDARTQRVLCSSVTAKASNRFSPLFCHMCQACNAEGCGHDCQLAVVRANNGECPGCGHTLSIEALRASENQ